ncbi:MAG: HAMP domain-containing histidine kinase [Flavobacteriaceae bacterium]|jgi:signal transduction histidine kinase|nr:HAMP domain-containing histidine kinase [Flavobacteriaceae bacterium]
MRLHNYTLKYLTFALLIIIAVWAAIFYAYILDEVYDNIDDGLKNSKLEIINESYRNSEILKTKEFGINHFRITPLPPGKYSPKNQIQTTMEYLGFDDEDEPVRILTTTFYDKEGNPYKLEIKTSMIEEDDLLKDLGTALIALYITLILSISILNYILLKKVWKSFYNLLSKLKKYTLGSKGKFISPNTKVKEFRDLEEEIEKMVSRNENTFTQQKVFISNAAHELQTPLAISINKLELLAENPQITEKQMEEITSIHNTLTRLVRLNKSLLMLTRIENNQFSEKENLSFNEIIKNSIKEFSDWTQHKNIKVTFEEKGIFLMEMDKGLAITLINNLLRNAIIHNYSSGNISLIISSDSFTISNTSHQFALDSEQIFNRFYRSTTNPQSTGLGLALVKTIINCYSELSIEYYYDGLQNFKVFKIG